MNTSIVKTLIMAATLIAIAFVIPLAAAIGNRLSPEAVAVLSGAFFGATALLPASILGALILFSGRGEGRKPIHDQGGRGENVTYIPPALPPGGYTVFVPSKAYRDETQKGYTFFIPPDDTSKR